MDGAIKPNQRTYWGITANQSSYTSARPSTWATKVDKRGAAFSHRRHNPKRNHDNNTKDMTDNEDAFCHRKLSSKNGIKNDSDYEICKSEERSMPSMIDVVWLI